MNPNPRQRRSESLRNIALTVRDAKLEKNLLHASRKSKTILQPHESKCLTHGVILHGNLPNRASLIARLCFRLPLMGTRHIQQLPTGNYPLCYDKGTPLIDTVPDILTRIVAKKREELARADVYATDQQELDAERHLLKRRDFRAALLANAPAIIAEVKKASPSKGVLAGDFDPAQIAAAYQQGGAAAVSVLTDEAFFQGSLRDMENARAAISLPVLRKDFTIDRRQIVEAAAHGADAILLIAAILTEYEIRCFREAAALYDMAALVEVHNRRELDIAIGAGSDIIGVNNRDLTTFEVTLETSLRLAEYIPAGALRISESGIDDADDIATLRAAGYSAFLVGEHLMKSGDPADALRKLVAA